MRLFRIEDISQLPPGKKGTGTFLGLEENFRKGACPLFLLLALGLLSAGNVWSAPAPEPEIIDNETCLECHGDPAETKYIDPESYRLSIHGANRCTSCHIDIKEIPHDSPLAEVSCGTCHRIETQLFLESDHGQALKAGTTEAASCRNCHGESHSLLDYRNPASPVFRQNIPKTCAECHEKSTDMKKFHLKQLEPVRTYTKSVHGLALEEGVISSAVCTDCHGSHGLSRATNPLSKLYWRNIPHTCGKCHENVSLTFMQSVHGKAVEEGKRDVPVCTDCHGEHTIDAVKQATSKVYPSHIRETCGQCHAAERIISKYSLPAHVIETYMDSYHGLAVRLGSVTAANCASCHGAHDILPSSDPRSWVYPGNLSKTCGKCHAGVGELVAKGQIHSGTRPGLEHVVVGYVRRFYIALFILVLGGMLLHNYLDFAKKLRIHYRQTLKTAVRQRMGLNERIQHAILAVTFIVLCYTGFALKFPQAWWASPFVGSMDWRGFGHRLAAALFCLLALYHVFYIVFTSRGRMHLRELLPRRTDLVQFGQMFSYYLGKRRERPVVGFYGYAEKMEYWALVWGSIVMVVTGIFLLKEEWSLTIFPKWFFDVVTAIHYYEAILASLAVLLWHGYFVMFDPDEYPMKWTWITGTPSPADEHHRRSSENV